MLDTPTQRPSGLQWIASLPFGVRVGVIVLPSVAYLVACLVGGPDMTAGLRPANLVIVVLAGLFFGMRGGLWVAGIAVVVNVVLYLHLGILLPTPGTFYGNVLSIIVGVAAAAGVGRVRDLTLALDTEVRMRQLAERRREELVELLVHDLKNPLTAISGHAQLLLDPGTQRSPGQRIESAQYIRTAAERISRMVMNLLDVGRAEDGQLVPHLQPVELPRLLEEVHGAVTRQLLDREQQLEIVQKSDDGRVCADPELLRRILLNLVENAIKYTPRRRAVRVELGGTDAEVELAVRDEGPGIPPGYEERIFDKYARLERDAGTAADASRGLGLHFCKLATAAHGGRIWVEPNSPQGTVFRIRLPRTPPARA